MPTLNEEKDDYTPPQQLTNKELAETIDIDSDREKIKAQLNAENDRPVAPSEPEPSLKDEVSPGSEKGESSEKPEPAQEPVFDEITNRYRDPVTKAFVADPKKAGIEKSKVAGAGGETETGKEEKTAEETPYAKATKAEKDAQRLARVVEDRQREIEAVRREAAEWRARAEQGPAEKDTQRTETQTRFNSDQFARAADEFAQQGFKHLEADDAEAAMQAFTWARKAQQSADQAYQAEQEQSIRQQQESFARTWQEHVQGVIREAAEKDIDLMDENGEDTKAIINILDTEEILNYLPDGFKKAWELHQLRKAYEQAPEKDKRIKELEDEVARLTGNATPARGQRPVHSGPKKFEDMTMSEQREYLRRKQYT